MRIRDLVKEDTGQIADIAAMAAVAGLAYPIMLAMVKGAFKTGKGFLKLRKIAQKAGVKLADKLVPKYEPLEEDWYDLYKQYTAIDDVTKPNLKDFYAKHGHDNFDPDNRDHVKGFIDNQSPEWMDWYAKNYGKKLDKYTQGNVETGYDHNLFGVKDKLKARGIDRNEIGKLYDLRDQIKTDHPDAYELIKQGKGAEAWKILTKQ